MWYWYVLCGFMGVMVGIGFTLGSWINYDNIKCHRRNRWLRKMDSILNDTDFCTVECSYYEQCYMRNEDPEIAQDELEHDYCYICPVKMARDHLKKWED